MERCRKKDQDKIDQMRLAEERLEWNMIWIEIYNFQKTLSNDLKNAEKVDLKKMGLYPTIGQNGEKLLINDKLAKRLFKFMCSQWWGNR